MYSLKKLTALILCACIALPVISCSSQPDANNSDLTETSAETTAEESTELSDELPEVNFGGETYTLLVRIGSEYEFNVSEETGDPINDAVYRREGTIGDRFNVKFDKVAVQSDWANNSFNNALNNTIMSGDDAYDIVAGYAAMILGAVQPNYYKNWLNMPHINLEKPWWSEQIADNFTINNQLYAMTGDLALTLWKNMITIFFNKTMAEDYHVSDMYELVRNDAWTFEAMMACCVGVSEDINGDGKYSAVDKFSYGSNWSTAVDAYLPAFDLQVLSRNEEGMLEYTLVNEKTVDAMDLINSFLHNDNRAYMTYDGEEGVLMFKEDRSLFYPNNLSSAESLRDMNTDYGLLPYPKYDDAQTKYYSTSTDGFSLFLIPATIGDEEFVGVITEALCAESHKQVIPLYYDVVLKDKYARDAESSEMLDIIRSNLVFDIGYINSYALNTAGHFFVQLLREKKSDIASKYAANEAKCVSALETMLEAYK